MPEMPFSESCIFCRIVKGELPSTRVYEDSDLLAFLDISPVSIGHTLLIPKAHYPTALDVPEALGGPLHAALARLGKALMAATGATGFNCLQNNFAASGQIVFHSHWHIIPRFEGDGLVHWPHIPYADHASMQAVAVAIRKHC